MKEKEHEVSWLRRWEDLREVGVGGDYDQNRLYEKKCNIKL